MVARVDWEERCWQLTHDVAVRLAIEVMESGEDQATLAGEAVKIAAATCEMYRRVIEIAGRPHGGQG